MKICRDCEIEKKEENFVKSKVFSSGIDTLCIMCNRKRVKQWRENNPEKRAAQSKLEGKKDYSRNKQLKYNYGITLEDYNDMFTKQNGCCAICNIHQSEIKKRLSVDHCHTTGKVRHLLCQSCNTILGMAKEDINILQNAITYLSK